MLNIGNQSSKYVRIWEVENKGKYTGVRCSSSKKNRDGTYDNSNWLINFVGCAHNKANELSKGDTIEITQGGISNTYDKENKTTYYNTVVFDFEFMNRSNSFAIQDDNSLPLDDFDENSLPF